MSDTRKSGPKERRFLDALRDLFVGAKVDGESGYINLMRIKAAYFERMVEPVLMKDITAALKSFPDFREELFDKLHAFFTRYFSKSGSICFAYTPQHMGVYERVYTDEQDVVLFWKTHMLYYVKTDRLFRDLKVEIGDHTFFFDCTAIIPSTKSSCLTSTPSLLNASIPASTHTAFSWAPLKSSVLLASSS